MSAGPPAHAAPDVQIGPADVERLVSDQHPDLLGPVVPLAVGWDNAIFRVGDGCLARMPRRALGATALEVEARWLGTFAGNLPVPVPVHLRAGKPDGGYPYPWALVPWFAGSPVGDRAPATPFAAQLLGFLAALHRPAPPSAPRHAARSMPLVRRDEQVRGLIRGLGRDSLTTALLGAIWDDALHAGEHEGPAVWVHGDLHPYNVLQVGGELAAVLDWGDLFAGDPAPDLAAAWMFLDPVDHGPFRVAAGPELWRRGRGWALYYGAILETAARDGAGAGLGRVGSRTLERLVAGGAPRR